MRHVFILSRIFFVFSPFYAFLQPLTNAPKNTDSLQTTKIITLFGKGLGSNFADRAATIQLISSEQQRAMPIRSVNEALAYVAGLDLRQRGVQGIQGDLSIRGGTFEQNIILVNGFKMVDPQTGHHALNLPVLLTNVKTIEVYKGSGTRIFGQNAMTGAVNFVTSPSIRSGVHVQTFGGSFGGLGVQTTLNVPIGKYRQSFSYGHDKSNGYGYNSDYTNQQLLYDAVAPLGKNQELRGLIGYTDRSFGANGYYTNAFPDQWESTQMAMAGISHQTVIKQLTLLSKVSLRTHRDEFRLKRFDPAFYTNKHWSEVVTLEETGKWISKLGTTGFGGEYRKEGLNSTNLGVRERTYISGFLDHGVTYFQSKLMLLGNIHYFNLNMNGITYQKWLPGLEISYLLPLDIKVFANIGRSYRAPSYTELFYQDYSNVGNPALQPEFATNVELGGTYSTAWGEVKNPKNERQSWRSKLILEASLYRRNTTNMIDWVRSTSSTPNPWTPVNLSNVVFTGVESNITYRRNGEKPIKINDLTVGYQYIDANHQFSDPTMVTESRYAFSGLRNQLIARMTISVTSWVNVSVAYRGVDRVGGNAYSLLDAKISVHPSRNITFFVEGNNLWNTLYVEAGYVQMPGRWLKAGLQFKTSKPVKHRKNLKDFIEDIYD
ncbi:MAG: TonB-dependent receptor plug domain-containing protein [Flavobacteriales bacterium]|jgi:vitamin B12 transporter